eukprot:COSAG03_NODE_18_length_21685_cov_15.938988_15_plen_196_part_00
MPATCRRRDRCAQCPAGRTHGRDGRTRPPCRCAVAVGAMAPPGLPAVPCTTCACCMTVDAGRCTTQRTPDAHGRRTPAPEDGEFQSHAEPADSQRTHVSGEDTQPEQLRGVVASVAPESPSQQLEGARCTDSERNASYSAADAERRLPTSTTYHREPQDATGAKAGACRPVAMQHRHDDVQHCPAALSNDGPART